MTLRRFIGDFSLVPATVGWYLADLGEFKGRQELFTRQAPQKLAALRNHALVESTVSSNRIEGVEIERSRINTVVFGSPHLRDRDEEEVQGYRRALSWIHDNSNAITVTEDTILNLHRRVRGEIWDAGQYKDKDGEIIQRYADGRSRVRFRPVSAKETPDQMKTLVSLYDDAARSHTIPPPVLIAAWNLDLLCIHPFRDGNGRVSRLLLLLQLYHWGFEAGRYISLERIIEDNKERYYETLELSSHGWHENRHDPWPYIQFILFVIKTAYKEFEQSLSDVGNGRGSKTELVHQAIGNTNDPFSISEIRDRCPEVSLEMIRRILKRLRTEKRIESLGRGRNARWRKTESW
jgi:Fic family protein